MSATQGRSPTPQCPLPQPMGSGPGTSKLPLRMKLR